MVERATPEAPLEDQLMRAYYYREDGTWGGGTDDFPEWDRWHAVAKVALASRPPSEPALGPGAGNRMLGMAVQWAHHLCHGKDALAAPYWTRMQQAAIAIDGEFLRYEEAQPAAAQESLTDEQIVAHAENLSNTVDHGREWGFDRPALIEFVRACLADAATQEPKSPK